MGIEAEESSTKPMGFAHQEDEQNSFVALDIGSLLAASNRDSTASPRIQLQKTLSRKGSQRGGERKAVEGDTTTHGSKGGGTSDKSSLLIHVASEAEALNPPRATTPTAEGGNVGGRFRRNGKRPQPWLDPRRVLLFFATLSSMGTIILLYFTLSMGKMGGGDVNAR